jgi:hypothetical protein
MQQHRRETLLALATMGGVTEQKPPGKSWESWIEEQIRQAQEDGAFRDPKLRHEAEVRARIAALNAEISRTNATASQEPPTRLAPLDVEAIVQDWRRARASDVSGT